MTFRRDPPVRQSAHGPGKEYGPRQRYLRPKSRYDTLCPFSRPRPPKKNLLILGAFGSEITKIPPMDEVLRWHTGEAVMLQTVSRLLPEFPLFLMTAVATHLVMSCAQTLMHYKLGHHSMGGKFFRNHINFHHTYYSKDHLVSRTYLGDEGNNTPFFFVPVFLVGACTYLLLPVDLFVVQAVACAASFYAHVFFDKEYHVEGSQLQRFAWFRRKQELHFVYHRYANSNFAVIHFFWDRILGTYRMPDGVRVSSVSRILARWRSTVSDSPDEFGG